MSPLHLRSKVVIGLLLLSALPAALRAQAPDTPAAAKSMQLPADQKALRAARDLNDPAEKIAATEKFLKDFPTSNRADSAHRLILQTLLASFPDRTEAIHRQAKYLVDHAKPGREKRNEQNTVAYDLAEAGPNGVDLKAAERWARSAVHDDTEARFTRDVLAMAPKDPKDRLTPEQIHTFYGEEHAAAQQTLADVYVRLGKPDEAAALIDSGLALDPQEGALFATRAELALLQHQPSQALDNFELAQLYGGITERQSRSMMQLYRDAHAGSVEDFDGEMDARYGKIFPPAFTPAPPPNLSAGHTVLVELFTGSGCDPCAGADLGLDAVLQSYPRRQVIALVYDLHIPRPDPLANPDGIARAGLYHVEHTPSGFVDGTALEFFGRRDAGAKVYKILSDNLNTTLPRDFGVHLDLEAHADATGLVTAHASVSAAHPERLAETLAAAAKTAATPDHPAVAPSRPSKLLVNFALVQDNIRYNGENSIRFHRMVVRALARPLELSSALEIEPRTPAAAVFDTHEISQSLAKYLDAFSKKNDRFGPIHFLSTDTTLPVSKLSVVAWVQDQATNQVLQCAIIPLQGSPVEQAKQ